MQPLFLEPRVEFQKTAAMTQLPEDPNAWPHEILQELYKQAPYIADFSPHVVMEKVDGEQGYGLGFVEVGNQTEIQAAATPEATAASGVRKVRVPVVIKDGMLFPFDLLVSDDSKVLPLTETRLRAAIFRPQAFDVTSRTPGDQSMIGQLYPPYRQSMGFGSGTMTSVGMGGMDKGGSALETYLGEKTAGFQEEAAQFMSADYLHAPEGTKQARYGKKVASGDARVGMMDELLSKSASALGAVNAALAGRGAASQAVKNTAAAKSHATAAMVRAKNIASKSGLLKKTGSLLADIAPTVYESDLLAFKRAMVDSDLQPLLYKNAAAMTPALEVLLTVPERPKFASALPSLVSPTVVQLKRTDEGYRVKAASHLLWAPFTEDIDRGAAVARFGEKVVLAADLSGAVTMSGEEPAAEDMEAAQPTAAPKSITAPGVYRVTTPEGEDVVGHVIPNLVDIDGTELPLALFTNGEQSIVQGDVVGVPVDEAVELPAGASEPHGRGVFITEGPEGTKATIPLDIQGSVDMGDGEPSLYRAESFTGEQVMVSLQPNIVAVTGTEDGKMLIPSSWSWLPLDHTDAVALESQEDGLGGKTASLRAADSTIELVSGHGGTYSLRGLPVEKLAHDEREMLGLDDTMFLLAGLGVPQKRGIEKLAKAMTGLEPVQVRVYHTLKLASDAAAEAVAAAREVLAHLPNLRQPHLFKEAAVLGDPQAVDTVLALGFLNPENLTTFVGYLPELEASQAKLCDILLASRLGSLIETPEGAVERSVRSVEAVLEGLKALAFQQN
jgi:hypothetical protein